MQTTMKNPRLRLPYVLAAATAAWLASPSAQAQQMSADEIIRGMRGGGYVLVMRHATSPMKPPAPRETARGNVDGERQLDDRGRAQMTAMGFAFRELGLPVGETLSSPTYRAVETAEYFGFGELVEVDELAPPGRAGGEPAYLAAKVTEAPAEGENRVIITHRPNIVEAFADTHGISAIEQGESLVFQPTGDGGADLVGRMTVKDWAVAAVN